MNTKIRTPQTHPDHAVVGAYFYSWNGEMYFCDSYDPLIGFWMTNVNDPQGRRNVSERAVDRTLHTQYGQVRAHHEHHAECDYHLVNLVQPDAALESIRPDKMTLGETGSVVFFDRFDAAQFQKNLVTATQVTRERLANCAV